MSNNLKIFLSILLVIILSLTIALVESNGKIDHLNDFIMPAVYSINISLLVFSPSLRKHLLKVIFIFFLIMIIFYLIGNLDLPNWFASLAFGSLIFVLFSYLPEIVKQGYISKF